MNHAPSPVDRIRSTANWVNLSTPLGLALARVGGARVSRGPHRLILAQRYRFRFPSAMAFTVGDVVLSRWTFDQLLARHPELLDHEAAHSRQWAMLGGLPFLPLYLAATAFSWVATGDRAAANPFERAAGLAAGGYRPVPRRRLWRGGRRRWIPSAP